MMNKFFKFTIFILILVIFVAPVLSMAAYDPAKGIVPCTNNCDFNQFMTLINNVINFMIFYLALPIAGIMFAYAGFLMVTAGEEASSARTQAKGIFSNALMGLCIALLSWVIVHSILEVMGYSGSWIGL
jgi:hypothetical protein